MHFTKTICTLLLLAFVAFNVQAQEEKKEEVQTAEESNTGGVDNAIDQGINAIGNLFNKKNKKKKKKGADEEPVNYEAEESNNRYEEEMPTRQNEYEDEDDSEDEEDYTQPVIEENDDPFVPNDFICSFTNSMTFYKNGKEKVKEGMDITLVMDRDKTAMKMLLREKGNTSLVVFNNRDRTMTTIPDVNGVQAMKMKQRKIKQIAEGAMDDTKITPTDDYKTIDNRKCRKYLVEDKEYDSTVWVAQDIDLDYGSFMDKMFGSKGQKQKGGSFSAVKGVPIESHGVSKDGKEEYRSKIRDIIIGNIDRTIFDLSNYQIMNLPSFGN